MIRSDGRSPDQLRPITFETGFSKYAEGSVLARFGDTHVLCNVSVDESLPRWLKNRANPHGWLTAEYAMLPRSTHQRINREQRWPKGRTQEISRLIGRSLRMSLDLDYLGERQLIVDCDVLQADGGTRTAAISAGWLAVSLALRPLIDQGIVNPKVEKHQIAAISVGLNNGLPILDLDYAEDVSADVDLNVVMTGEGDLVEIQGTAEKSPFHQDELVQLLALAGQGIRQLLHHQKEVFKNL
jgi:ribonuclease PH